MSNELTYEDENGDVVYTSQFLSKRGTCCKTSCLHCPYEFTLKKHGLQFKEIALADLETAQKYINSSNPESESAASMLLSSAFGGKAKVSKISEQNLSSFAFVILKEVICGVVEKGSLQVKELYLDKRFQNQKLTKDLVGSYL